MKFVYRCGDRPLPGYTIKRGIGYGGFGEVYFAISDGGKEVALKWIRANLDVELRGVQQCLNLKHPNLLHLYDLKIDNQGNHWLVMEYVSGEPLSNILSRHPKGVALELAAEWFHGMAGAIHYLHENGIVHRDLKPGNIFLENGIIKVGDYGLCKAIGSQRGGMTQNVGTCYYMAPEISTGNYSREIDVYAAGVILFEMLTGKVPFDGQTVAEVQMKHLTSMPNLGGVPREITPLIDQALTKNPASRFSNLAEMSRKVSAAIRGMAAPAYAPVAKAGLAAGAPAQAIPLVQPVPTVNLVTNPITIFTTSLRGYVKSLSGSMLSAAGLAFAGSALWSLTFLGASWNSFVLLLLLSILCVWGIFAPTKILDSFGDDTWMRRIVMLSVGMFIGLTAVWLQGYDIPFPGSPPSDLPNALAGWNPENPVVRRGGGFFSSFGENRSMPVLTCYLAYFGLAFFLMRWPQLINKSRTRRISIRSTLTLAFWAFILMFLLPSAAHRQIAFVALIIGGLAVQAISPWQPKAQARAKRVRLRMADRRVEVPA